MLIIQILSLVVAGLVSYHFSKPDKAIWESILGLVLAIPAGLIADSVTASIIASITESGPITQLMMTAFWFSIFGGFGSLIYGQKRLRSN